MKPGERIYLDTNVYNALTDRLSPAQVRRIRPSLAGAALPEPSLSPVIILELVQTADELRREKLVYLVQHFCADKLLVEPEELVLDFIIEEMKREDLNQLRPTNVFCRTDLARVWDDVRTDSRKTFVIPDRLRPGLKIIKSLYGLLHAQLARPPTLGNTRLSLIGVDDLQLVDAMLRAEAAAVRKLPRSTEQVEVLLHHTWMLAVALVGSRSSLFSERLDPLWNALGIHETGDKVEYLFSKMDFLFRGGPVFTMAAWLASQADRKYDQGNMFDGYNLMYLPYVHSFLTLDENVLRFAEPHQSHPTMAKVQHAEAFIEAVVTAVG